MVSFHLYGFFIGLGIVAGLLVVEKIQKKFPVARYQIPISYLLLWLVIFGLIGARLYHVINYWWYYSKNQLEVFSLWQGGFGIFGAVAGGIAGLWIFLKLKTPAKFSRCSTREIQAGRQNAKFWKQFLIYLDIISFGLPVGQAIGRIGNYFNQELYGLPTNLPWGIYINPENRLPGYGSFSRFQPLFLYEAIWDLTIFIGLISLISLIGKVKPGFFFFLYLGFYGFGRFWLEFLRIDPWRIGVIDVAQGISLGLVVISLIGLIRRI